MNYISIVIKNTFPRLIQYHSACKHWKRSYFMPWDKAFTSQALEQLFNNSLLILKISSLFSLLLKNHSDIWLRFTWSHLQEGTTQEIQVHNCTIRLYSLLPSPAFFFFPAISCLILQDIIQHQITFNMHELLKICRKWSV